MVPGPASPSVPCATLTRVPDTANPYRDEIASYLRRARCHYGATFLHEEAGLTVEEAARELNVKPAQVNYCRRGVHNVLNGEFAATKTQSTYDEAVLRALLHFRGEMTEGLRQRVDARLNRLRTKFSLTTGAEPLRCSYGFDNPGKSTTPPRRPPVPTGDYEMVAVAAPEPPVASDETRPDAPGYADAAHTQRVDDLAMKLAIENATRRWPEAAVERMPHNNPGFDIAIRCPIGATHFIEVKGTCSLEPGFFISAGEVAYSHTNSECYSIWIYHSMDLDSGTAELIEHDGPVTAEHFELHPVQFRGRYSGGR